MWLRTAFLTLTSVCAISPPLAGQAPFVELASVLLQEMQEDLALEAGEAGRPAKTLVLDVRDQDRRPLMARVAARSGLATTESLAADLCYPAESNCELVVAELGDLLVDGETSRLRVKLPRSRHAGEYSIVEGIFDRSADGGWKFREIRFIMTT